MTQETLASEIIQLVERFISDLERLLLRKKLKPRTMKITVTRAAKKA